MLTEQVFRRCYCETQINCWPGPSTGRRIAKITCYRAVSVRVLIVMSHREREKIWQMHIYWVGIRGVGKRNLISAGPIFKNWFIEPIPLTSQLSQLNIVELYESAQISCNSSVQEYCLLEKLQYSAQVTKAYNMVSCRKGLCLFR